MNKLSKFDISTIIKLRMDGLSVGSIVKITGFSKATISKYCRGLRENNKSRGNINNIKPGQDVWKDKRSHIIKESKFKWESIKQNTDIIGLIALYWAEGKKRGKGQTQSFSIVNSDPGIIKHCINTINKIGNYKIAADVTIYPEQNGESCADKWEEFIGIRPKVYVKQWRREAKKQKLYSKYGVCRIYVYKSFELWHSVMTWIDCWRKELGINESCQL